MIRNVLTEIWRWSGQGRNKQKKNAVHQQQTLQKQIKLRTACQQSITSYCIHLSKHFRGKINKLKMRIQESCVFLLIRFVFILFQLKWTFNIRLNVWMRKSGWSEAPKTIKRAQHFIFETGKKSQFKEMLLRCCGFSAAIPEHTHEKWERREEKTV